MQAGVDEVENKGTVVTTPPHPPPLEIRLAIFFSKGNWM